MVVTSTHHTPMVTEHPSIDGYGELDVQRDAQGLLYVQAAAG
jgi:sugar-phosphatase